MSKLMFGQALAGIALLSSVVIGCTTEGGDTPTPDVSPSPEPGAAFTVGVECVAGSDVSGDIVYLSVDTTDSGKTLAEYPTVELYDDYTKEYYDNDPTKAYAEDHTLELFDSGRSSIKVYEYWERDLAIAVDGNGNPDVDEQIPDVNTIFTCDFFDNTEVTYVFCATDNETLEEHCYAGGKHPTTFCSDCEAAE